jgi:hypothetical protein
MSEAFIFVSCGQYTAAEKSLGKAIVRMVESLTGLDAFFAEEVQDLSGLDTNILDALRRCAAFITVIHPRGEIVRPDGSRLTRASVWIEQEIAIATYIQRIEKRSLPVIAFVHESVGLEGIRQLLHLNPIRFSDEMEILSALPERLTQWKDLPAGGVQIQLRSHTVGLEQEHMISKLVVSLANNSTQRITKFNCQVRMPSSVLSHWNAGSVLNDSAEKDRRYRSLRFDESTYALDIPPYSSQELFTECYCTQCGAKAEGGISAAVSQSVVEAKAWIDGREYSTKKTIEELARERLDRESKRLRQFLV